MANVLQKILITATVLLLIVVVVFSTSNQAHTAKITSNRINSITLEEIGILEQVNQPTQEADIPTKITSVEQISDVSPSDPYFKALKTLIDDYQIDVTLPDGSFRGNQPITRGYLVIYLRNTLELIREFILPRGDITIYFNDIEKEISKIQNLIFSIDDDHDVLFQRIEQIKTKLNALESKIHQSEQSLLVQLVAALSQTNKQAHGDKKNLVKFNTAREQFSQKQVNQSQPKNHLLAQLTSIQDIPDVSSDDSYYEALREIVENYKVDVTLPDGTFQGNQAITRGEVIIYLNDGIARLNELITPPEDPELELRVDNLLSQATHEYFDFIEKLAQIKQIEAQLNELESRIEEYNKSR